MARAADPHLPARIAAAADALWREGGEAAVTIRDVAARARTTTPSVYAHFKDRAAIVAAIRQLARGRFEAEMEKATGLADGNRRLLAIAEKAPRDYELLFGYGYRQRVAADRLAAEFAGFEAHVAAVGVPAARVRETALALISLLHGAAMFRLAHDKPTPWWAEIKAATLAACEDLIAARRSGKRR